MSIRSFGRGVKRALGYKVSVSPSKEFEHDPDNPGKYRKIQTRSPPFSGYREASDRYYEMKRLTLEQEEAVTTMIGQINNYFNINVDTSDGNIRFIIRQIISVHGLTGDCIELIQRCRPLLYAISDVISRSATTASIGLKQQVRKLGPIFENLAQEAASFAEQSLRNTAQYASNQMSRGLEIFISRQPESSVRSGIARSISPVRNEGVGMMHGAVLATKNFTTQALSGLCSMLLNILGRASDILTQCVGARASLVASAASSAFNELCAYLTPQRAVEQAVNQAVPEAPDLKCSICMSDADEDATLTRCSHRFHAGCIMPWLSSHNTCPNCRQIAIPTRPAPVPRQGGGGLKKYRSKTKSRSKSKSRRYISKPHKSRKARKRIRHSSSRRK
jgi:hypothetical protein